MSKYRRSIWKKDGVMKEIEPIDNTKSYKRFVKEKKPKPEPEEIILLRKKNKLKPEEEEFLENKYNP